MVWLWKKKAPGRSGFFSQMEGWIMGKNFLFARIGGENLKFFLGSCVLKRFFKIFFQMDVKSLFLKRV